MIGVYGGTFDPVHFGHLRPALEILEDFALSQIRFIPCGQPPHRTQAQASAALRLAMLQRAIEGVEGFVTDTREIERGGPSYMVDTLRSLHEDLPGESLCLILGTDAFAAFDTWHKWHDILTLCNLLVMQRPEFDPLQVIKSPDLLRLVTEKQVQTPSAFCENVPGKLMFYPVTQLDISSTRIREAVRQQHQLRFLLPDSVIGMIEQQGIYH